MKRILLALGSLAALAATAVAQVPPPIPALPDSERRIAYSISGTTCACSLGFSLWEDGVDVDQQISVWINGVQYLSTDVAHGWGLTSATGPLASIPRPITDAVLTFTLVQTGTIQIVGAARPRRLSQFTTTPTVRDFNQVLTYLTAAERERWDLNSRQLRGLPGETLSVLPAQATRASTIFGWDSSGNPTAVAPNIGLGTVVGPAVSVNGHIAVFNGTNGQLIADGGALSTTPANPTGIVGCTPVNGVAATIMRSDGAPGLNLAASCTYTGNSTLSPTSGNALTINPLGASLGQGFVITQTPAGVLASDTAVNTIAVTTSATGAGKLLAGLQSTISTTSTSANGADTGVFGAAALIQATTNAYQGIGVTGTCVSAVSSGGSGTGAGTSKGACFGFNSNSQLQNGAVNFNNLVSYEADVAAATGSSVYYKGGITAALGSNDAVRGSVFDCGLCISSNTVVGSWKNPILIGPMNGQTPVASDSVLLASTGAAAVNSFIDFSSYTCSGGKEINFTNFTVDCSGNIVGASLTSPSIVGGSGTTGTQLTLKTTTGTGTTDQFAFVGGTNGATTFATLKAGGIYIPAFSSGLLLTNNAAVQYAAVQAGANGHYLLLNAPSNATFFQARDADNGGGDANFGYLSNDTLQITNRANNANFATFTTAGLTVQSGGITFAALAWSRTAPTISAGFCTSPSIVANNGVAAFTINVGSACAASTGTIGLPTATTGWVCSFYDVTTPNTNVINQTGGTASTATLTNYVRTTGVAGNFTSSDVIRATCVGY